MTAEATPVAAEDVHGWATYPYLWRVPGLPQLLLGYVLARLPTGMVMLAFTLATIERTGSVALSGLVSGCYAVGMGVGTPVTGRLVDRRGPIRVLTVTGLLYPLALLAFAASAAGQVPVGAWSLPVTAVLAGLVLPPVAPVVRSVWAADLDPTATRAANGVENTLICAFWVAGPALVGLLAAHQLTPVALLVAAFSNALGVPLVALHSRARALPRTVGRVRRLEALRQPGMPTVLLLLMAYPAGTTGLEFAVITWAGDQGHPGWTGAVFAAAAAAGVVVALVHGAGHTRVSAVPLATWYVLWAASLAALVVVVGLDGDFVAVLAVAALAECATAPMFSMLVDRLREAASPQLRTESFGWRLTALMAGGAVGAPLSGAVASLAGRTGPAALGFGVAVAATYLAVRTTRPTASP